MIFKLLQLITMGVKYSFWGIVLQAVFMANLMAIEGQAQYRSVKDTYVKLELTSASIEEAFSQIQQQTNYTFFYNKKELRNTPDFSKKTGTYRVSEVLMEISQKAKLKFRQVNNNIAVTPFKKGSRRSGALEVILAEVKISGKITDENGEGLPGASIVVKGTANGTTTNLDGKYSLTTEEGATLVVSYVGYATQEIVVGTRSVIDIKMEPDAESLEEIVITGLGLEKSSRSVGYSMQQVKAIEVLEAAPVDLSQGLQGKIAGLNISTSNGLNNASSRIVIRGNNSLFGRNQPLIVIDGAIVENTELEQGNVGNNQDNYRDWGNYLSYLDMSTVEEISVLKGPNAAALYGARGANGVILITSKKGRKRDGVGINYSHTTNFTNVTRFQEVQNEFGGGFRAGLFTANPELPQTATGERFPAILYPYNWSGNPYPGFTGIESYHGTVPGGYNSWDLFSWFGAGASWGPRMDGTQVLGWEGDMRPYSPQPNNREYMYKTGTESVHNVSFSSATDMGSIRLGVVRKTGDAVVENTDYNSTSFSLGSRVNISEMFSADITAGYNQNYRLNAPEIGNNNSWSKFSIYGMSRDYYPIEKDKYFGEDGYDGYRVNFGGAYPHAEYSRDLFWHVYENNSRLWRDDFISTVKLNATITPWLDAFVRTSANVIGTRFEEINNTRNNDGVGLGGGSYRSTVSKDRSFNTDVMAIFHKENVFADGFNFSATLGYNQFKQNNRSVKAENNSEFKVPNIYSLSNWKNRNDTKFSEGRRDVESYSYFGLLDLSYKNFLFMQLTGRNDITSTLAPDNNSTFYPSMNASFVFSDAFDLGAASDILSYGSLRVALGKSANATDPYQLNAFFDTGSFGGQTTISRPDVIPPANLTFQTSTSKEIGLSLGLLKNAINVDFTYYDILSDNQIMDAAVALSSGANKVRFNSGELSNKGIEFVINADVIKNSNFSWNVRFNGAKNTNKVIALAEGVEEQQIATVFGSLGAFMKASPGENYGTIYGTDFERDDQGRKIVENIYDKDDPTKVIGTQYRVTQDVQPIGNAAPKMTGGIGNTFRYKGFSLSALVDFKLGGDIYSIDHAVSMGSGLAPETAAARNGGGLPYTYPDGSTDDVGMIMDGYNIDDERTNDRVIHPIYYYGITYAGWSHLNRPRSLSVFENSWVKMRELTLTYRVPKEILQRTNVFQSLSVSFVGRNLFYLYTTLPDKLNPEAINGTGNGQGLQWSAFPSMRTLGFSVNVGF